MVVFAISHDYALEGKSKDGKAENEVMAGKKKPREERQKKSERRQVNIDVDLAETAEYVAKIRSEEEGRRISMPDIVNEVLRKAMPDLYARAIELEAEQLKKRKEAFRISQRKEA